MTLSATIKDTLPECLPNITRAKVSFFISTNGGSSFSPVSSGQNLPVGLVDPRDFSTGTASVISQFDLGKNQSAQLWVKVVVGGEYTLTSDEFNVPVTVAVPGQINTLVAGGTLTNDGVSLAGSSGFLANGYLGRGDGLTSGALQASSVDFGGQVAYNKSLTNPQGQLSITIHSYNKPDGTPDTVEHTYWIKSNSIADMALVAGTASFSSKTNVYEVTGGTKAGLDGGGVMQMTFTPAGGTYQVTASTGSTVTLTCPAISGGCVGVTAYKSAGAGGGVWFSSAWGAVTSGGLPQSIEKTIKANSGSTYIK